MAIAKRRKRFFPVEIPLIRKETQLMGYSLEELEGKLIKYDLTRSLRGKSLLFQSEVKIKDGNAIAIPRKIKLLPYYLKRMVRKGTNYVEDSFSTKCKDAKLKVKPFLITRRKVSRAVRKTLRNKAREELKKYCEKRESKDIFGDILKNNLQKKLSLILKKIYPLSLCEIRILKVEERFEEEKNMEKKTSDKKTKKKKSEKVDEKKSE